MGNSIIDFKDYEHLFKPKRHPLKVYTGKENGEYIRKKLKIDELIDRYDKIIIKIPNHVCSINPSFFENLFKNAVIKLGREKFYNKFEFESPKYNYEQPLREAVNRVIRKKNYL